MQVEVNQRATRDLVIVNCGKMKFNYKWVLTERSARKQRMVSLTNPVGTVLCSNEAKCQLAFCPTTRTVLRGCELTLEVSARFIQDLINVSFALNIT